MSLHSRLRSTWRALWSPSLAADMEDEFREHIAQRAADLESRGLPAGAALRQARLEFGSVQRYREEGRAARGLNVLDELAQDVSYGVRVLRRSPLFSVVAILTLAVGVGATTAVFSAVRGVLLRPLPYPDADALVVPRTLDVESGDDWATSLADYEMWRDADVFAHVGVFQEYEANLAGLDAPERVDAVEVSHGFFEALGVTPALGSLFSTEDYTFGSAPRVIISHAFWQRRFGGDSNVLGATVRIGGTPYELIGVLPAGRGYPAYADVWAPAQMTPSQFESSRRFDNYVFRAIARLAPARGLDATRERLATLAADVSRREPVTRSGVTVTAVPLTRHMVGQSTTRALWVFLAGVALVLLIGCVNLANLLLARAATRVREIAIRGSIGATRARIARQFLTESVLLGIAGGAAGMVIAWFGTRTLVQLAPSNTPRLDDVRMDLAVLAFAFATSLAATLIFGLVPALRASRQSAAAALVASDRRATIGPRGRRERNVLLAAELALSLVLLIGAGLQLRSFARLQTTDPGFAVADLLTFSVS
jgi:putative ABC transport system permease protein